MFGKMSGMVNNYFGITLYIDVGNKKDKKRWGNNNDGDMVHKCKPQVVASIPVRGQLG